MKHEWSDCIMAVAEAAKTSDEPWAVLQKCLYNPSEDDAHQGWFDCNNGADLGELFLPNNPYIEYRIKPRTILINGIEVSEPLRVKPEMNSSYYIAQDQYVGTDDYSKPVFMPLRFSWTDSPFDNYWFYCFVGWLQADMIFLFIKFLKWRFVTIY